MKGQRNEMVWKPLGGGRALLLAGRGEVQIVMEEDWRRIDIDAFDPESGRLTVQDLTPPDVVPVSMAEVQPVMAQIRTLASSGDTSGAVKLALASPPYGADESTKGQYLQAVLGALTQTRQADIPQVVQTLNHNERDVLVKYLYKGMAVPEGQKQGAILLAWFEKLTQAAGVNPIVHYLSDRRAV